MSSLQAKFVTDRRTDNGKRIWPLAFDAGGGCERVLWRVLVENEHQQSISRCTGHHNITEITVSDLLSIETYKDDELLLSKIIRILTTLRIKLFENIVGKVENAGDQYFLLFQQSFLPFQRQLKTFYKHFICFLQMLSTLYLIFQF